MKQNSILIWKGFKWSRLLSFNIHHWTYAMIQLCTLSRYCHTAVLRKYHSKWYLYQSVFKQGIHIIEINKGWIFEKILSNEIDVFECKTKLNKKKDVLLQSKIREMYQTRETIKYFGKYDFANLLNQLPYQLFNTSFVDNKLPVKSICSQLTHSCFFPHEDCEKVSPAKIATNDDRYTRVQ